MKTLQPITTTILTLVVLIAGTLGFALQAYTCESGQCEFAMYTYEEPTGTYGTYFTGGGTWHTRTINTDVIEEVGSPASISRSGNEITLQPGTYYIHVVAYQSCGYRTRLRLRTTDDTTTLAVGQAYGNVYGFENQLLTYLAVSSATTFRIEQYDSGTDGYDGVPAWGDEPEVYMTVRIVKVTADKCH